MSRWLRNMFESDEEYDDAGFEADREEGMQAAWDDFREQCPDGQYYQCETCDTRYSEYSELPNCEQCTDALAEVKAREQREIDREAHADALFSEWKDERGRRE